MRKTKVTRRELLRSAAQAGAVLALPAIIPASVLGKNGAVPPSEKIVAGGIGIQHRGMDDLQALIGQPDVQFVAICDLQKKQRLAVKNFVDTRYGSQGLRHVPGDQRLPGRAAGHRRRADRHGRPLARHGVDPGDAGRQGRLHREAVLHDDCRGPRGGGDGTPLRPRLPDRHAAAQRGQPRLRHRDGPHGPPGQDPHRLRPHRPLGRRRDAPRLAAGRRPAAQGRGGLGRLAGRLPVAALQPRATSPAGGGASTISTPVASASGARTPSPRPRRDWVAARPRPSSTSMSPTTAATAWSPTSPTACG